jgi:outer membrane protein OmpA-like peptidoglycan-associated protein
MGQAIHGASLPSISKVIYCPGEMLARASRWLVPVWLILLSQPAFAQTSLVLDRLEPTSPDSTFFSTMSASSGQGSPLRFGLVGSYARAPLVVSRRNSGATRREDAISAQELVHVQFAYRLHERLTLDADLPLVFTDAGAAASTVSEQGFLLPSSGLGSPRLGAKLTLSEPSRTLPATGMSARVWLPLGDTGGAGSAVAHEESTSYAFDLIASNTHGPVHYGVNFGRRRQWHDSVLPTLQSSWTMRAGVAYRLGSLQVGPELLGSTSVDDFSRAFARRNNHLEALLGVRYRLGPFVLGVAAGPGLAKGPGTPRYRALFSIAIDPAYGHIEAHKHRNAEEETHLTESSASRAAKSPDKKARAFVPSSAEGTSGMIGSGSRDNDGDGIANGIDACPNASGVASNLAERHGCPPDRDGDGIIDGEDACPDVVGSTSPDPTRNGCKSLVRVTGQSLVISQQIQFATGGDVVLPASEPTLLELSQLLGEHPEITRIAVDGHTDNVGRDANNLGLSRRRALAVVRWLVAHGVDERRLEARGFGPKQPLESNDTEAGRSKNRRVEFIIRKRSAEGSAAWQGGVVND